VDQVDVTALGESHSAVEDCLRVEAYTWSMPEGGGQLLVPITLGVWNPPDPRADPDRDPDPVPDTKPKKPKPTHAEPKPERGKVIIIHDDDDDGD
jgi:hypothetical protein